MRVYIKGQTRAIQLTKREFVGQGGQASVYARGEVAFKLYTDPQGMIPVDKIDALAAIGDTQVIRPQQVVLDPKNVPIGYTMRFLKNAYTLCQLFPRAFREREGLTPEAVVRLVVQLRTLLQRVHDAGVLVVDLNEMNVMVDRDLKTAFLIDVDSYQTPKYPATAIMESVRDRHAPRGQFSTGTDWFSFAIVSFQLFTGIHPYKGRHSTIKGMEQRMQANVSVLSPDVRVPKACYPPQVIPAGWRSWYEAVLDRGERIPAPIDARGSLRLSAIRPRTIAGNATLQITEHSLFSSDILHLAGGHGAVCVVTAQGVYVDGRQVYGPLIGAHRVAIGFAPRSNTAIVASLTGQELSLLDTRRREAVPFLLEVDALTDHHGRLYVRTEDQILELCFHEVGDRRVATTQRVAQVLPNATRLYPGCALQNLLGAAWACLFVGPGHCEAVRLAALDGAQIVDARYDNQVLMVLAAQGGVYTRHVFRFSSDFQEQDCWREADVSPSGLSFVSLEQGTVVHLDEQDHLALFANRPGSKQRRQLDSDALGGDLRLGQMDQKVYVTRGPQIYQLTLRR